MSACFECSASAEHEHHVVPRSLGGTRTIPLCGKCHGKVHGRDTLSNSKLTRTAMMKRARAGLATGAVALGYRTVPTPQGHVIEIDPDAAAVVRDVFRMYLEGRSPFEVASELNRRGLSAPRGGAWQGSTVRMMLLNERYAGRWPFGTRQWRRDPETRRRRPQARNAPLVVQERPELAIVDAETWQAVRKMMELMSSRTHRGCALAQRRRIA